MPNTQKGDKRPSHEPYLEASAFENTNEITLFNKPNYKVAISIELN